GVLLLAFLILVLQSAIGFSLESAAAAQADSSVESERASAKTPENLEKVNIKRGAELGRLSVHRTVWFRLAVLFNLLGVAAAGLELWLERRGSRPLPRLDVHW